MRRDEALKLAQQTLIDTCGPQLLDVRLVQAIADAFMAIAAQAAKDEREACARDFDTAVDALPDAYWRDPAGVARLQDFIRARSKP